MRRVDRAQALLQRSRVKEWGVHLVVYFLAGSAYAASFDDVPEGFWRSAISVLLPQLCAYPAVYLLNDYADADDDRIKKGFSRPQPPLLPALLLVMLAVTLAVLSSDGATIWVTLLVIGTGVAYSVPPLRLKGRGLAGVVTASFAQRLPFFLVLCFRHPVNPIPAALVAFYLAATGLLFILHHQREDMEVDRITGVQTWGVRAGPVCLSCSIRGTSAALLLAVGVLWIRIATQQARGGSSLRFAGAFAGLTLLTLALFNLRYDGTRHGRA